MNSSSLFQFPTITHFIPITSHESSKFVILFAMPKSKLKVHLIKIIIN